MFLHYVNTSIISKGKMAAKTNYFPIYREDVAHKLFVSIGMLYTAVLWLWTWMVWTYWHIFWKHACISYLWCAADRKPKVASVFSDRSDRMDMAVCNLWEKAAFS